MSWKVNWLSRRGWSQRCAETVDWWLLRGFYELIIGLSTIEPPRRVSRYDTFYRGFVGRNETDWNSLLLLFPTAKWIISKFRGGVNRMIRLPKGNDATFTRNREISTWSLVLNPPSIHETNLLDRSGSQGNIRYLVFLFFYIHKFIQRLIVF